MIDAPGLLTKRIAVLAPTTTQTASGGFTTTWATLGYAYGAVARPARGTYYEKTLGGQSVVGELAEFTLRTTTVALDAKQRLQLDGVSYEIVRLERQYPFAFAIGRKVV